VAQGVDLALELLHLAAQALVDALDLGELGPERPVAGQALLVEDPERHADDRDDEQAEGERPRRGAANAGHGGSIGPAPHTVQKRAVRSVASEGAPLAYAEAMGADEGGLRVLYRRPELCMAETRGMILMLQLGAMRVEWLPAMHAAHIETAERYGGPRPFIALSRPDPRYPIDVGFDANLPELKRAFERMLPYFRACAVIVDIDGFLGAALYRGLRFIGMLARREPPM